MADTRANPNLTPEIWDDQFFVEYLTENRYAGEFGSNENSIIQVKEDLTKKKGDRVNFALVNKLTQDAVTGRGIMEGNEEDMATRSFELAVDKRRNAVRVAEIDEQYSAISLRQAGKATLKEWAMKDTERLVTKAIGVMKTAAGSVQMTAAAITADGGTIADVWLAKNSDRVFFGNSAYAASSGDLSAGLATLTAGTAAERLTAANIDAMKFMAMNRANPKIRPIRTEANGRHYFILYAHPRAFRDLRGDSTISQAQRDVSLEMENNRLFKGGVTAGSENSWYLRSTLVAPPAPAPGEPAVTPPVPAPAPGQPDLPDPVAGESVPLYRPEVPVYAAAPRGAAIIARQALGTFHQRQGDQQLLAGQGALPASWGQAYGGALRQQWSGTVSPSLDGDLLGFKVGQDLYATVSDNGYRQQIGVYVGHSRLDADVKGFSLAVEDRSVGDLVLDGKSVGVYWTLVAPQRWYLDAVVQYTDLDGRARSDRGGKLELDGHAWTASLESGLPVALSKRWTLEPQAQLIAQKTSLDSASDGVSRISHDAQVELTSRLGVRLEGAFKVAGERLLQPYAQINLWHGDGGRDTLTFDGVDRIKTDYRYTSVQLEGGLVARLDRNLSLHGGVQYTSNLDSRQQETSSVNLGVRWQF